MKIRAFITHKLDEDYSSCQDRFHINSDKKRLAISDGMSQSIFPDYWADIVSKHVANEFRFDEDDRLSLCERWKQLVEKYIKDEKAANRNPWRLESNLTLGYSAGCTFCGVSFSNKRDWEGMVLGDSCIIEINKKTGDILGVYSSESKQFDSYPDYVDSNPKKNGRGEIKKFTGILSKDVCLLVVSDPFSEFLYNHKDDSQKYVAALLNIKNHSDYIELVENWRNDKMHNDDSTMIIVEYDGRDSFDIDTASCDDINDLIEKENLPSDAIDSAENGLKYDSEHVELFFSQLNQDNIIDSFIKAYRPQYKLWRIYNKHRDKEFKRCLKMFMEYVRQQNNNNKNMDHE